MSEDYSESTTAIENVTQLSEDAVINDADMYPDESVCEENLNLIHEVVTPAEAKKVQICKDFQNKGCHRVKCKFLHLTYDEQADYEQTGKLPKHGGRPKYSDNVCRDFLNGKCHRGSHCKYVHVKERELINGGGTLINGIYRKRSRIDGGTPESEAALIEENKLLLDKIADIEKEIVSLREMNDVLSEENSRFHTHLRITNTSTLSQTSTYNQASYSQYSSSLYNAYSQYSSTYSQGIHPLYNYSMYYYQGAYPQYMYQNQVVYQQQATMSMYGY